jgi:hypothetical protein
MRAYDTGTSFHSIIHQPISDIDFERVTLEVRLSDDGGRIRVTANALLPFIRGPGNWPFANTVLMQRS